MLVTGCGSSNGSPSDAGGDISHKPGCGAQIICNVDAGDDSGGSAGFTGDGTTGQPCKKDSDCIGDGGPGINLCSNNPIFLANVTNVQVNLYPSPICLVPPAAGGNCDPAPPSDPTGTGLYQCDGPNSICVPFNPNSPQPGMGECQPVCMSSLDGTQATGCTGQNTCNVPYVLTDSNNNLMGVGYCQGACEKDSDCSGLNDTRGADGGPAWVCQVDIGFCTQHPRTRTKPIGAACTSAGRSDDNTTGACYCPLGNTLNQGYCTQSCIVGGSVPCPNGWQCDDLQLADLGGVPVTKETLYAPGICMPACSSADGGTQVHDAGNLPDQGSPPADASSSDASDDGEASTSGTGDAAGSQADSSTPADAGTVSPAACPPNSTCQSTTVLGPECSP
jgi:hypothetical protein